MAWASRHWVAALVVGVFAAGCGDGSEVPSSANGVPAATASSEREATIPDLPLLDAAWETVADSPLTARGQANWAGDGARVTIFGGATHEPNSFDNPCDSEAAGKAAASATVVRLVNAGPENMQLACSYAAPEPILQVGAATWDAATNTWTSATDGGSSLASGRMHVTDGVAVALRSDLYLLAEDRWDPRLPREDGFLTYQAGWWTGQAYVEVGCLYTGEAADAPLIATTWRPGQADWTNVPAPFAGQCPEAAPTLWHDDRLLVLAAGDGGAQLLVFDPAASTWASGGVLSTGGTLVDDGHRVLLVSGGHVASLNADTARTTPVSTMPGEFQPHTEPVWTGTHLVWVDRDPSTADVAWNSDTDTWTRLPELPDADRPPTYDPVIEPLEGGVLVWGGMAQYDAPSRNSDTGFVLRIS